MRETTAGELGSILPIGVEVGNGGPRNRSFAFRPWRGRDERTIGALRDKNRSMAPGQFTTRVLSYFLTNWGGRSFEGLGESERWHAIASSYMADVLYAWCALRRAAMGDTLDVQLTCPFCHHIFPFAGNLAALPIVAVDDEDELREPYQLVDDFNYLGSPAKLLTLEPSRWAVYENMGSGGLNLGVIKLRTIAASIVGVDGKDARVAAEMLDDLTKRDLEGLFQRIADRQPGPDMRINTACSACGMEINRSYSWGYEVFFSATSSLDGEA